MLRQMKRTNLVISRPSGETRYCTIHWHASELLDSNTSTVAIHSSVSTLHNTTRRAVTKSCRGALLPPPTAACVDLPELLFGVQVGVKEKVNSQLKRLFGHRLVVWML